MHLVIEIDARRSELEVAFATSATVADLLEAVGAPTQPPAVATVDGRAVLADTPLSEVGLVEGSVLRLHADDAPLSGVGTRPALELRVVGGLLAGTARPLPAGRHVVGREGDVALPSSTISARHAELFVAADGSCAITDLGSLNGVRVDGEMVQQARALRPESLVELGAVQVRLAPPDPAADAGAATPDAEGRIPVNRPPRPARPAPAASLRVPSPPRAESSRSSLSWAAVLAPLVFGLVLAMVAGAQAWVYALLVLLSPLIAIGTWYEERWRARSRERSGQEGYRRGLAELERHLSRLRSGELAHRRDTLPDPTEITRLAVTGAPPLWGRRPDHDDFLRLRLGIGTLPWQPLTLGDDERSEEVERLIRRFDRLPSVPVPVQLGVRRVVGVAGPRQPALALARSLVCQAAVLHGPADLRIAVFTRPDRAGDWDWAKWLPHTVDGAERRLAASDEEVESLVSGLTEDVRQTAEQRPTDVASSRGTGGRGPVTLLVVDTEGISDRRWSHVRQLLASHACTGIVLAPEVQRLPALCAEVLELIGEHGLARFSDSSSPSVVDDILVAGMPEPVARDCARSLARFDDPEAHADDGGLPPAVSLLQLLHLPDPGAKSVAARWRTGAGPAVDAERPSLSATIGVGTQGTFAVDLIGDGPHGLVAGTTGSGKSELLRTLVASLATSYDAEALNFVLVDYKGGSAFDACARLPHTVGVVTDLDGHLAERALRCLEAELRRRERQLRTAGVGDLASYRRLPKERAAQRHEEPAEAAAGAGVAGLEPLPRLAVVVDEFATLAADLPDFLDSLVDVAQRGRSLGVHLILATQRPSGVVNDHIRANTNLRVALRVQDPSESVDVLGAPDAANIGRGQAGRAYARLGPGEVVAFQTAFCSGPAAVEGGRPVGVRPFTFGLRGGDGSRDDADQGDERPSELSLLVDAVVAAHRAQGVRNPRKPWPEPLPERLLLHDPRLQLPARVEREPWLQAPLGLADDPEQQRQMPYVVDSRRGNLLLYGIAGSGTTTALATLAISLARRHAPDQLHLYVLDFGSQALAPLVGLPHVGAVIAADERERQERLLRLLRLELGRRRERSAQLRGADAAPGGPAPPHVVVLVDNYAGFAAALDDVSGLALRDEFHRLVADGPAFRIHVVMTADRVTAVPNAVASVVADKLLFRLPDRYDYGAFGLPPDRQPPALPGRAVDAVTGREVQIAQPSEGDLAAGVDAVAALYPASTLVGPLPQPIGVLPAVVKVDDLEDAADLSGTEWLLPVGIGEETLRPTGLRLAAGDHALVAGPGRSGKSTLLAVLGDLVARHRPDVAITVVALRPSPVRDLAGASRVVTDPDQLQEALTEAADAPGPQVLLVDDAEVVDDAGGALSRLLSRQDEVRILAAGRTDALRGLYGHWTQEVRHSRQGVALRPHGELDGDLWQMTWPRRRPAPFPVGRGYLVRDGAAELVQAAGR